MKGAIKYVFKQWDSFIINFWLQNINNESRCMFLYMYSAFDL